MRGSRVLLNKWKLLFWIYRMW